MGVADIYLALTDHTNTQPQLDVIKSIYEFTLYSTNIK
jgi:hypothetical protein